MFQSHLSLALLLHSQVPRMALGADPEGALRGRATNCRFAALQDVLGWHYIPSSGFLQGPVERCEAV